jgi:hypothetical protein
MISISLLLVLALCTGLYSVRVNLDNITAVNF